ncbi:MAG: NAD-dependent epimerase/dehydratase family protein [bacterium]|nr:NAD-dependent epimerase/dehydratase family protein [bacterium]
MKKILVLGGSGFLGSHVVNILKKRGFSVVSLSRKEGCDIRRYDEFKKFLSDVGPDVIINCAAHVGSVHYALQYGADMIRDNTWIAMNMYQAVAETCPSVKIINPLSNCSYPGNSDVQVEDHWESGSIHETVLPFGSVKRLLYAFSESYRRQYGVQTVNWIIANAYGPGDYCDPTKTHALNGLIVRLIHAKRSGEKTFEIWGSGAPIREWVYIQDVAKIMVDSLENEDQGHPINFAQRKGHTITEIAAISAQMLNYSVTFTFNTAYPDGDPVKILDDRVFRGKYPLFQFTDIKEGIKETIRYYESVL